MRGRKQKRQNKAMMGRKQRVATTKMPIAEEIQDKTNTSSGTSILSFFKRRSSRRSSTSNNRSDNTHRKLKKTMSKAAKNHLQLLPKLSSTNHHAFSQLVPEEITETMTTATNSEPFNLPLHSQDHPSPHQQPPTRRLSLAQENLILINTQRYKAGVPALHRSYELDALAAVQVEAMLRKTTTTMIVNDDNIHTSNNHQSQLELQHSCQSSLRQRLGLYWGENVAIGETIQDIHTVMMMTSTTMTPSSSSSALPAPPAKEEARNIKDPYFRQIGIATAKTKDGNHIILCQLFRG